MNQKTREASSDLAYRENDFAEVLCTSAKVEIGGEVGRWGRDVKYLLVLFVLVLGVTIRS
jgi:hypothetical protein